MNLKERINLLAQLGNYMKGNEESWQTAKRKAFAENQWFMPEFINLSTEQIADNYLKENQLNLLADRYNIPENNISPKNVGIVMAGNIPLVGFHDLLCVFITGNHASIKPSSKDDVLIRHIVDKMVEWQPGSAHYFTISSMIKNCDAYIATGSNNSSRYFDYYFQKYPHIIRKNRTSVAIVTGNESESELQALADDVYLYFGLGCRNVTKLYVPTNYEFLPLLEAFRKYDRLITHHKYKNNLDYNLAVHILNNKYYMTNDTIILAEEDKLFSPISQLNFEYYSDLEKLRQELKHNEQVQCIVSSQDVSFGQAQCPAITDYADGVDTMQFLMDLAKA